MAILWLDIITRNTWCEQICYKQYKDSKVWLLKLPNVWFLSLFNDILTGCHYESRGAKTYIGGNEVLC